MSKLRTSSVVEVLLPLRRDDAMPLHRQLEDALRQAVRSERLAAGTVLPSSRALAEQLGVSRGIVVEAYEQLVAEGYLTARPGGATRVAHATAAVASAATPSATNRTAFDVEFRPGRPDLALFPREAWQRSIRRVLGEAPSARFGYLDGRGVPELRAALAAYLNRVRGTAAIADDMVISTGFVQGLRLVAEALRATGHRRIGLEDPGHAESQSAVRAAGLEVVGIPVDEAGMRVDVLAASSADAALVTAAHQYPTGGVLPPERRAALIEWAEHRGGVVIEDDYDAEFRYDREPIGALQGLAPERVVYAGSASKVLAPGLRLGWLIAPARLVGPIAAAKLAADAGSPALEQLAFADFLERGELDRHLRRMRTIYRRRRDAVLAALAHHLPGLEPVGASAGLHVLAWLPAQPGWDERAIIAAANEAGIAIDGLSARLIEQDGRQGLVFGYGSVPETDADAWVGRLASVIAAVNRGQAAPRG